MSIATLELRRLIEELEGLLGGAGVLAATGRFPFGFVTA
jgi:hypothetical protein